MTPPFDWNDIKVLLAVVEAGTTLGAARMLGASQSTVARRVQAMEQSLGLLLFDKRPGGYVPTPEGQELIEAARSASAAVARLVARAAALQRAAGGPVRLATNDSFANHVLDPAIAAFRRERSDIDVEIVASDRFADLSAGEADIALRAGRRPEQPDLFGRKIAKDDWSIYCSSDYAGRHGVPRSVAELAGHKVIGVPADMPSSPLVDWLRANVPDRAIAVRRDSVEAVLSSLRNGTGVSLMSDFIARSQPNLVFCFAPELPDLGEVWLVTHERLRQVPRIRTLFDFLSGYFRERRHERPSEGAPA